jgi:hypothetical protein
MNLKKNIEKLFVMQSQDVDERRKHIFLVFSIFISIPFISLFAIDDLMSNRMAEGIFIFIIIAILILNIFAIKYIACIERIYQFSVFLVLLLLGYELAIGGGDGYAFLWFYFYPLAIFYLLGKKEGLLWVLISLFVSGFLFLTPIFYEYEIGISIRFLITYSILIVLSFGLESARHRYYEKLLHEKRLLEIALADRKLLEKEQGKLIEELREALEKIKTLRGLLPICSHCKKIRDSKGYWNNLEAYIQEHSDVLFSHSLCSECSDELYADEDWYIEMKADQKNK